MKRGLIQMGNIYNEYNKNKTMGNDEASFMSREEGGSKNYMS